MSLFAFDVTARAALKRHVVILKASVAGDGCHTCCVWRWTNSYQRGTAADEGDAAITVGGRFTLHLVVIGLCGYDNSDAEDRPE
ncbi:MAG: hypothetical protein QOH25_1940 [Acidobacteriota bacterium]|nr:hypothetical protein [Acidobacteriota bacterium]